MPNNYSGSIQVQFNQLPSVIPQLLKTQFSSVVERFKGAIKRRWFHLESDWSITVNGFQYDPNLNGTIIIPETYQNVKTRIDGASVPLPSVVSFLTFGILRSLGVMLTASVVHDFVFKYGVLVIRDASGTDTPQPVARDVADLLFRDIISTVNRMPITAYVAWIFVRLGWFGIKYNGQPRGVAFPLIPVAIALVVLALVIGAIQQLGLVTVFITFALFYLIAYAIIAFYQ